MLKIAVTTVALACAASAAMADDVAKKPLPHRVGTVTAVHDSGSTAATVAEFTAPQTDIATRVAAATLRKTDSAVVPRPADHLASAAVAPASATVATRATAAASAVGSQARSTAAATAPASPAHVAVSATAPQPPAAAVKVAASGATEKRDPAMSFAATR